MMNLKQLAESLSISYSRLQSALWHHRIPEPKIRIGSVRLFDKAEAEFIRHYFSTQKRGAK